MGKTKRIAEMAYLDPDKHALLVALAKETRIPRSVFLREAVDDLLVKYKRLKAPRKSAK